MFIKELEIDNFKSFAHEVKMPFLEGFTTVCGPNGSGKSNIIDSILFALGFATLKKMRAEKSEDYICTKSNKKEAFVRVTFGFEEHPDEIVTVSRKFSKNSQGYSSTYTLNGKVSTLGDIHAKLEKYNITPNSYNVVMQREVTNITGCSDTERRKIIEEIAGTAEFDRQTEKAEEELAIVKQRVEQTEIITAELSKTLERLEEEKEVALKYQKLRDEKIILESKIGAVKFFDIKRALELAHESILEASKKKKEVEFELKDIEEKILQINKKYEEAEEKVKQNGEEEQLNLAKQIVEAKGYISTKTDATEAAEKNIHSNRRSIENQKNGIENAQRRINSALEAIAKIDEKIKNVENKISQKNEELNKILSEVSGLSKTAEAFIAQRVQASKELENLKFEEIEFQKKILPLENELSNSQKEFKIAKDALENHKNLKADFADKKDRLELEIKELEKEQTDFKTIRENSFIELDGFKNKLTDKSREIRLLYQKTATLEAKMNAGEALADRAVTTVMRSGLRGIRATLADLGKVAGKYATALEVAMGARMRNIVVENTNVAKAAIDILQTAKAGRATFLPLDKIAKAPSSLRLPKEKGVIDFAVNLIDFDDEYLDAFFLALGETLIVEDFEDAKALQSKLPGKYRIVTLQGALFERSGAITGGDRINKPGMNFARSDDELDKFKEKLKEAENEYAALENKISETEKRQEILRQNYSDSLNNLNKAKTELRNLESNFESSEEKLVLYEDTVKNLAPKIKEIKQKLDDAEIKRVEINGKILETQDIIADIDKKTNEGELKKLKDLTSSVEEEIKKLQAEITGLNADKTEQNNIIGFQKIVTETNERTISEYEESIQKLEEDKKKFANDIDAANEKLKDLEKKSGELNEKLDMFRKERDEVKKELLDTEKRKNVLENDIEKIAEQTESYRARRRELEPELEAIKKELTDAGVNVETLTPSEMTTEQINSEIQKLQKKMTEMEPVNMTAVKTYETQSARKKELDEKINTLLKEREHIEERMNGYETDKKEAFVKTFNAINENFEEIFKTLTDGEGSLILETPETPFEGGLSIIASPGRKDNKKLSMSLMSGGEQSITALAFVFAIQKYSPAPFYALDEVDGSLDTFNVEKVADVIQKQSKNTQFIVVSHRPPMIQSADRTIGVTHEDGVTKLTGITLRNK